MAGTAVNNSISIEIILLYLSAIFWTIGYDTIYGVQDIKDDEIIGLKSTSIKFKKNIKIFVFSAYLISLIFIILAFKKELSMAQTTIFFLIFIISLTYQIKNFDRLKPNSCLRAFRVNNFSGFYLFITILLFN